jgi:hypothetical protein
MVSMSVIDYDGLAWFGECTIFERNLMIVTQKHVNWIYIVRLLFALFHVQLNIDSRLKIC